MKVVIVGGHGKVARHLGRILGDRGDQPIGVIRDERQVSDLREDGMEPALHDLEEDEASHLAELIDGAAAVVFAAGAGPGSGAARKETVDYGGAVQLIDAAEQAGVSRYVMVSAMGTDDPPEGDDVFSVYLRAKARADEELMNSGLDWTIVRPGRLTDEPGTGLVRLARHVQRGEVPREDVAEVLAEVLRRPDTGGHVFELVSGERQIPDALDQLVDGRA
ncbi:MAG: SDR family oxidoreductase [Nitriliruptorales bacterium]|nr:SDR family oxidoreductase [Nitriliruptorales bacterium]